MKRWHGQQGFEEWLNATLQNTSHMDIDTIHVVKTIQDAVIDKGDDALCEFAKTWDASNITPDTLCVTKEEQQSAYERVPDALIDALRAAEENIRHYHQTQLPKNWEHKGQDITYGVQFSAMDAVGLYVPGGRAEYPSSVLMNGIPAQLAGCKRVVMVTPAKNGTIPDSVLVAADIIGIHEIYKVGGAQAIFALAYGTSVIAPVDKIVGPGNKYVTAAKQWVYGKVDIDKPAGPSEVCVAMDDTSNPTYAAAEMLAQLEHDPDASACCIVYSNAMADAVEDEIQTQLNGLKRQDIINASMTPKGDENREPRAVGNT